MERHTISYDGFAWNKRMAFVELHSVTRPPFHQRSEQGPQAFAERGKPIFDALEVRVSGQATHQSMLLQRSQLLDQHLLRDAGNALLQVACALRAIQQDMHDDRFPAAGKDAQRALDRQAGKSLDDLHVEPLTNACVDRMSGEK